MRLYDTLQSPFHFLSTFIQKIQLSSLEHAVHIVSAAVKHQFYSQAFPHPDRSDQVGTRVRGIADENRTGFS
jgi:hypothetical protein